MADKTTNLQLQKIDDTDYAGNFPTVYNNNLDLIDGLKSDLITSVAGKQDKLIAGSGITIGSDGKTVSASGKEYTAGNGINISADGVISTKAPSEITVYSPIILFTRNYESDLRAGQSKQLTTVSFGTGKRTTNSYSIPVNNSLKTFNTVNKILATWESIEFNSLNFPNFIPKDIPVHLSIIVLDNNYSLITTVSKNISLNDMGGHYIRIESNANARDGNFTFYLTNVSW